MSNEQLGHRAALQRQWIITGDARQLGLSQMMLDAATVPNMDPLQCAEHLTAYLLAPTRTCLLATDANRAAWLADSPLFRAVGPGNAVPFDDGAAALATMPMWLGLAEFSPLLMRHRFAPRADDVMAVALSAMDVGAQVNVLAQLFADRGPDADVLHLSTLQCGRILAWCPHLLEWPIGEAIVDQLLRLLAPTQPRPLQLLVARALGPIAARSAPLALRVRTVVRELLERCDAPAVVPAGLGAFVAQINTPQDRGHAEYLARPARQLAQTCALILGHGAPLDPAGFGELAEACIDRPAADLFAPFVDGLIAGAHHNGLAVLVAQLVEDGDHDELALSILQRFPNDAAAPWLIAATENASDAVRADACKALTLVESADVEAALRARLRDPALAVVCASATALQARGCSDVLQTHVAQESHAVRRAIVAACHGSVATDVIGELAHAAVVAMEAEDETTGPALATCLHNALLHSIEGAAVGVNLMRGAPATVAPLATAIAATTVEHAFRVPPLLAAEFVATIDIVHQADISLQPYAMFVAAAVNAGAVELAHRVCADLIEDDGQGAIRLATLGLLDVRDEVTGAAVTSCLNDDQALADRVLATTIAGRALPFEHPGWETVRGLLQVGTIASAAAWTALRDRCR